MVMPTDEELEKLSEEEYNALLESVSLQKPDNFDERVEEIREALEAAGGQSEICRIINELRIEEAKALLKRIYEK